MTTSRTAPDPTLPEVEEEADESTEGEVAEEAPATPPSPEYEALVTDPCVTSHIESMLSGKVEDAVQRKDLLQQVRCRLLVCKDPPDSLDRVLRLATTITRGKVVDYYRRDEVRRRREVPYEEQPLDEEDEENGHGVGLRSQIAAAAQEVVQPSVSYSQAETVYVNERRAFLEKQIAEGVVSREDVEIAARTGLQETTYAEEARALGTTEGALRVRTHRIRTLLRTRFAKFSAGTLGTLLLMWLLATIIAALMSGGVGRSRGPDPVPSSTPTLAPPQN